MSKWNSRKLAALVGGLVANVLIWGRSDSVVAEAFATAAVDAVTLGYVIVQGWVDAVQARK